MPLVVRRGKTTASMIDFTGAKFANTREAFGQALLELGAEDPDVVALTADLRSSTFTKAFGEKFPERFFDTGVAEANMMGIAAGLAMSGKKPFATTFAIFVEKAFEQIRQAIAYQAAPVKIIATHGGLVTGPDGASHQTVEDINTMRGLPNMTVIVPADAIETKEVTRAIVNYNKPVYVRLAREPLPLVLSEDYRFELGKAKILREGKDVTLFACGVMVFMALRAAELLEAAALPLEAQVVNVSTVKPMDVDTISNCVKKTGCCVTAEDHSVIGGLGSAVAEVLVEKFLVPMERVGVKDKFGQSGKAWELLEYYQLTPEAIAAAARRVIERKAAGPQPQ